jgi:adenosine/AMP kinase
MVELARKDAAGIGAGHCFIVFLGDGFCLHMLGFLIVAKEER